MYFLPNADHWEVDKAGNRIMIANERGLKEKTIGVDRSKAIESTKHEIKALQQELSRNKQEEKAVKDASFKSKKAWNQAQKQHQKLTSNVKKMEAILDELKAEAETSEEVPTIDTTEYEADIEDAENSVQELKKQEAEITEDIANLQPAYKDQKKQLSEISARNKKILDDMDKVDNKLEDIVKGQRRREEQRDKVKAKVNQAVTLTEQQEEIVKEFKVKVANALDGARRMQFHYERDLNMFQVKKENNGEIPEGQEVDLEPTDEDLEAIETVDPPKESKYYKAKVQSKEKKIEQEKERRNMSESDPAVARDKYFRAKNALDSKMAQIDAITRNCTSLKKDLASRKDRWRAFRSHIAEMTNLNFDEFLNKKGSAGEVEFDHSGKTMNLVVQKVCLAICVTNNYFFNPRHSFSHLCALISTG